MPPLDRKHSFPRRGRLRALLVAALFAAGCGGLGPPDPSGVAAPTFTTVPGTVAAQGSVYTYQIATSPSGATLNVVTAPTGATLTGNTLTWTPTAAQSRVANQFTVNATSSAGTMNQSWSVTPAGTVNGTFVVTYWTSSGQVETPFPWPAGFPVALVPQVNGSFQTVQGSGNADGSFSVPNVPGGYYWLEVGPPLIYWTSASAIDLGADLSGEPPSSTPTASTTTISVTFSGLDPLQPQDEMSFMGPVTITSNNPQPTGATTFTTAAVVNSNIDFSQPRTAFLLQYKPESLGVLNVLGLGPEVTLQNLALTNGTSNIVNGTLAPSPQISFDLSVQGSAWPALFENVAPTAPTLEGSDLSVSALPFMNGHTLPVSGFGERVALLFDAQPASGFGTVLPGEPPITTDQDFGVAAYDDPFPTGWPRVFTFSQTATTQVALPNSTSPYTFQLIASQSSVLPSSQIAPLIGPVQNPKINGTNLFASSTVSASGVTLNWTAPGGTTPTGYRITTFNAHALPNGTWTYSAGMTFFTTKTSASLPPLPSGTCVFKITSILDGAANFETQPNRSALPAASASVISAPITMQ